MFGNEIRKIRLDHNLTQTQLAEATGLPQNTISWIESDKGIANIQQCVKLADYYGISLDELVGREINNK
ncbi:MAG: helix-turn-helix transcriptional regulator [Clostridia bacterium]|nr:helix-turn-helix transcriptional regulator [Clostridia bacterium]